MLEVLQNCYYSSLWVVRSMLSFAPLGLALITSAPAHDEIRLKSEEKHVCERIWYMIEMGLVCHEKSRPDVRRELP